MNPQDMSGVDIRLERLYERFGPRMIVLYQVLAWTSGFALGLTLCLILARVVRMSSSELALLIVVGTTTTIIGCALASAGLLRSIRPLTAWLEDPIPDEALRAWEIALRIPQTSVRYNAALAALTTVPVTWVAAVIVPLDFDDIFASWLGLMVAVFVAGATTLFTSQLVIRPILRRTSAAVDAPPPDSGLTVRRKLLLFLPAIGLVACAGGVVLSLSPGDDVGGTIPTVLLAGAVVLLLGVPVALLLAFSTLQPLDDLTRATERLKRGDFDTRVPALTGDEHGVLARSFNEAMEGLAERQRLADDNARLLIEVRDLLDEVSASRARIVAASDAERRRVERNIHDGAQQRLVALALQLSLLEEGATDDAQRVLAAKSREDLGLALAELRELARGLHPQVLSTGGLEPALRQLAARSPVPVSVDAPSERYPDPVESTAYFVVSEALANVAKYAEASRVEVSAIRRHGSLVVAVSDDGIGGADADAGSGLAGLADRVAALNGRLTLESAAQAGTTVTAELPLEVDGR